MSKNILIFGATGVIGKYITDAIVGSKASFDRIVIFTSPATADKKASQVDRLKKLSIESFVGDIQNDGDVRKAYEGIDTVVSALGRNVIAHQIDLIKLADQSSSVKRFFPSEYGTDIDYWPNSVHEKPHQQKLKVRAAMKYVKDLDYTYVVTGPYSDMYMGPFSAYPEAGSFNVKEKKAVILGDGTEKISFTSMEDVGKLVVAALLHPDASRNRALKVNSFTTTNNEIVEEFERQTGSQWSKSHTPLPRLKEIEEKAWAEGVPYATPITLRRIWMQGGTLYERTDNESIQAPKMETLADQVKVVIAQQTAT